LTSGGEWLWIGQACGFSRCLPGEKPTMRLHQSRARRPRRLAGHVPCTRSFRAEPLESRTLLNATVVSGIDAQELAPGTGATNIDLSPHFSDPTITGTPVV